MQLGAAEVDTEEARRLLTTQMEQLHQAWNVSLCCCVVATLFRHHCFVMSLCQRVVVTTRRYINASLCHVV
jgi:hypothetical protein